MRKDEIMSVEEIEENDAIELFNFGKALHEKAEEAVELLDFCQRMESNTNTFIESFPYTLVFPVVSPYNGARKIRMTLEIVGD